MLLDSVDLPTPPLGLATTITGMTASLSSAGVMKGIILAQGTRDYL